MAMGDNLILTVGYHVSPVQVASGPELADEEVTFRNIRKGIPRSGPIGGITDHQGLTI